MTKIIIRLGLIFTFYLSTGICAANDLKSHEPKIIGGEDAFRNEFPWIINMLLKPGYSHRCGGVIINKDWVLSAAHCVPLGFDATTDIELVAGDYNQVITEDTEQRVRVSRSILHPNYNAAINLAYDFALLKVSPSFQFTTAVQNVSLPEKDTETATGNVTLAGWGLVNYSSNLIPDVLQKVILKIVPLAACKTFYEAKNITNTIFPQMICASDGDLKSGCNGDSGSGLIEIVQHNETTVTHVLQGIVSFGLTGCNGGDDVPGVFANVHEVLDWIHDTTNSAVASRASTVIELVLCFILLISLKL